MLEDRIKELEKLGKPIVHCNEFKFNKFGLQSIRVEYMTGNGFYNNYWCGEIEEKDGILITDDFIFIKE